MRQKNIKTCHNLLCQTFENVQKTRNKWASELKKNDVFFWKIKKNYKMIIEVKFASSVLVNSKIEKTWLVNKKNFNSNWNKKIVN